MGLCKFSARVDLDALQQVAALNEVDHFVQVVGAIDFQAIDHGGFVGILHGHDEGFVAHLARHNGHGQHAAHRAHAAIEAQFADKHPATPVGGREHFAGCHEAEGEGEVVAAAFLAHVGGREVDGGVA